MRSHPSRRPNGLLRANGEPDPFVVRIQPTLKLRRTCRLRSLPAIATWATAGLESKRTDLNKNHFLYNTHALVDVGIKRK